MFVHLLHCHGVCLRMIHCSFSTPCEHIIDDIVCLLIQSHIASTLLATIGRHKSHAPVLRHLGPLPLPPLRNPFLASCPDMCSRSMISVGICTSTVRLHLLVCHSSI